jgi:hypothetical protein
VDLDHGMLHLRLKNGEDGDRAASLREIVESVDTERLGLNVFWFTHASAWDLDEPERFLSAPIWTTGSGQQESFL